MRINGKIFFIFLFLCGIGICAGSFFEVGLGDATKSALSSVFNLIFQSSESTASGIYESDMFSSVFFALAKTSLLPLLFSCLSAFLIFLLPLLPIYILLKGICIGFSAAMSLETFGLKGILYILVTLMPQNLIQIPIYCLLCALSLQLGGLFASLFLHEHMPNFVYTAFPHLQNRSSARSSRKQFASALRFYLGIYLLGAVLIALSCLIQACLLPLVS